MDTLVEAKQYLRQNYEDGCNCPACGQMVKLYKRKLNSSMAYALIIMRNLTVKHGGGKYFKMNEEIAKLKIPSSNVEYSKLAYWELVEEMVNTDDKKRTSGMWRLTTKGMEFILNTKSTVSKYVYIYNNRVKGLSPEQTNIHDALGSKFNYSELMVGI